MRRPNILFLYTDQQRWDTLAANGNPLIHTPHLDRLASHGCNFRTCIAQNPVCMPSRISALTGQYCSTLRLSHMAVTVPEETLTLPRMLRNYGYHNGLVGKLHFLPHSNRDHRWPHPDYGFHHLELSDEPGCYDDAYRAWVRRLAPQHLDSISLGLPPVTEVWQRMLGCSDGLTHPPRTDREPIAFPGPDDLTHTAFVGRQSLEYLRQHRGEPFFLFSGFYSPHSPLVAPQRYLDLYDPADMPVPAFPPELEARRPEGLTDQLIREATVGYYAMISEVDHWVGRVLDGLQELGLADETIVVFTSDHGEWLGEHLRFGKGHWAPDVISRVPLLWRVPERLGGASRRVDDIVECVDIVPTLLDLAGIPIPPVVQGDLLPVTAQRTECAGDGLGLCEHFGWRSLRLPGYRYVAEANGTERLFDLTTDPWEYHDVSADPGHAEALDAARRALIRRMIRIEQPLQREWPY
ncbi:MAG: sulfatase-like hydrolase/transferase [Armatimonadetes bacterium]|nr:sulfatase-like hydrolase/transferase [Armatimonadota bacterium]